MDDMTKFAIQFFIQRAFPSTLVVLVAVREVKELEGDSADGVLVKPLNLKERRIRAGYIRIAVKINYGKGFQDFYSEER